MKLLIYLFAICYICEQTCGYLSNYHYDCNLDCGQHGSCRYRFSKKYCSCSSGYIGDRCQYTDHCHSRPCHHSGRCQNTNSRPYFKCTCVYGYLGERCEDDHCISSPCQNGGKCRYHWENRYYLCTCYNGFNGGNCEVSPCDSNPCKNHGKCSMQRGRPYFRCSCSNGYTGIHCENAPAIVTLPAVTSSSTSTMTSIISSPTQQTTPATNLPNIKQSCSKVSAVFDLAEKVIETNPGAVICHSGSHSSPEAFVLNNCGFKTTSSAWKQGYSVISWCDKIPPYTPVASFQHGKYVPSTSITGIFIGCLIGSNGFSIAIQECDQFAHIEHIVAENNTLNYNFNDFFTIKL